MSKTTYRKWKIGLWIAVVLGLLSAGAGLVAGMKWQAFVAVLCTSILSHLGAYFIKSPLEDVAFDDDITADHPQTPDNNPPKLN